MLRPENVGLLACHACKNKSPCIRIGTVCVCATCTRVLVAGWAVLGRLYPATAEGLVLESRMLIGEAITDPRGV